MNEHSSVWYTYMIRCEDNSLYTGITTDPVRRFREHVSGRKGKGARYTAVRKPLRMEGLFSSESRKTAASLEARIKHLTHPEKEGLLRGTYPDWWEEDIWKMQEVPAELRDTKGHMKEKQIIFFDIDGTLWDYESVIPQSTIDAIHALQENGHLCFINTGRTKGFVRDPKLLGIGFDGLVTGCGTMIEYHGDTIYYYRMDRDFAERAVSTAKKHNFRAILEGKDYLYFDDEDFEGDAYGEKVRIDMGDALRGITENWGEWEMSKLSCDTRAADREAGYAEFAKEFDLILHNEAVCELVPKGFSKGTGVKHVCELLNHPIEQTIAFGDSVNDLEMFRAVGTAVCLGDGAEEAKKEADYITTAQAEDGIWNACRKLGLI